MVKLPVEEFVIKIQSEIKAAETDCLGCAHSLHAARRAESGWCRIHRPAYHGNAHGRDRSLANGGIGEHRTGVEFVLHRSVYGDLRVYPLLNYARCDGSDHRNGSVLLGHVGCKCGGPGEGPAYAFVAAFDEPF